MSRFDDTGSEWKHILVAGLVGGLFGRDTAGGYFAIEEETESVVYNYIFDFDKAAADVPNFVETLEKVLQLCDIWTDRIRGDLTGATDASDRNTDAADTQTYSSAPAREFRFEV